MEDDDDEYFGLQFMLTQFSKNVRLPTAHFNWGLGQPSRYSVTRLGLSDQKGPYQPIAPRNLTLLEYLVCFAEV
jgi:hypothetical protein